MDFTDKPFSIVFPLPDKDILQADMNTILCAFALMKLAGQVSLQLEDMEYLSKEFAGYVVTYHPEQKTFSAKLYTRRGD